LFYKKLTITGALLLPAVFMSVAEATGNHTTMQNDAVISEHDSNQQEGDLVGEISPVTGYDWKGTNGFFIRSKDARFRLNFGAYTQARYDINWQQESAGDNDVEKEFSFNRTRIFFKGDATPMLNYHVRFNIDEDGDSDLVVGFLQFNMGKKWSLRAGKQFIAMSREDWMWAEDILTTEFSAHDSTFALGAAEGLQAYFQSSKQRFWLALSNGSAAANALAASEDQADIALTGRWEYQLRGKDWSVWDDLIGRKGRSQGILLGLGAGYQSEKEQSILDRVAQLNADISINGDGYQAMLAASLTQHLPREGSSFTNYGMLAQGGYFFTEHVQLYTQYNLVSPGDQPGDVDTFQSISAGLNYFPFSWTNRLKFSAEFAHLFSIFNNTIVAPSASLGWLPSDEDKQTYLRLQAQFGF
jgi:hypothetical protein